MTEFSKTSTDILEEILGIKGVNGIVVIGRDGFVIESLGQIPNSNLDLLGASLATAINSILEMGSELKMGAFSDLFVNYKNALIMCFPVGDAICGITGDDSTALGLIRHKTQKLIPELERLL